MALVCSANSCKDKRDCFSNKGGVCVCLARTDFQGKDCPFYKKSKKSDVERK